MKDLFLVVCVAFAALVTGAHFHKPLCEHVVHCK